MVEGEPGGGGWRGDCDLPADVCGRWRGAWSPPTHPASAHSPPLGSPSVVPYPIRHPPGWGSPGESGRWGARRMQGPVLCPPNSRGESRWAPCCDSVRYAALGLRPVPGTLLSHGGGLRRRGITFPLGDPLGDPPGGGLADPLSVSIQFPWTITPMAYPDLYSQG